MWGVFLSFEGTYIKSFILLRRMECKQSVFLKKTVFYIRELTFLKVLKILTGGTYILR